MPSRLDLGLNPGMAMPGDALLNSPTIVTPLISIPTLVSASSLYAYSALTPSFTFKRDLLTGFIGSGVRLGWIDFASNSNNLNSLPFLNPMYVGAELAVYADEAWSATKGGTRFELSTTLNGGLIRATRVIVDNAGTVYGGATAAGAKWSIDQNGNIITNGSLGATGTRVVKGWFTDLQTTNFISGPGVSGSAATLTNPRNIDGQAFDGSGNITVIAPGTHAATSKTTPVDADELPLVDSAASNVLKKLTWANTKAGLKSYFDTLYQPVETTIANHFANAAITNAINSDQDMWSDSIPLATLVTNGDRIEARYEVDLANNTHSKQVGVDVAGTRIANFAESIANAYALVVEVDIVRKDNATLRVTAKWTASPLASNTSALVQTGYAEIASLNLTTTAYNLKIVANNLTNASTTDIIGRMGKARYIPA